MHAETHTICWQTRQLSKWGVNLRQRAGLSAVTENQYHNLSFITSHSLYKKQRLQFKLVFDFGWMLLRPPPSTVRTNKRRGQTQVGTRSDCVNWSWWLQLLLIRLDCFDKKQKSDNRPQLFLRQTDPLGRGSNKNNQREKKMSFIFFPFFMSLAEAGRNFDHLWNCRLGSWACKYHQTSRTKWWVVSRSRVTSGWIILLHMTRVSSGFFLFVWCVKRRKKKRPGTRATGLPPGQTRCLASSVA